MRIGSGSGVESTGIQNERMVNDDLEVISGGVGDGEEIKMMVG